MATYYINVESGGSYANATLHASKECALSQDGPYPRPISGDVVAANAPTCDECVGAGHAEKAAEVRDADTDDLTALDDADVDVEAIADDIIADRTDNGVCPWCDDYEGEHVGQHASSAHSNAWADYKDD